MLLSHIRRFIFLKTIKTGGTSVEVYFEPWCLRPGAPPGEPDRCPEIVSDCGIVGSRGSAVGTWFNHMPAAAVRSLVGDKTWNEYFKFTVVRNPFDKVVSQFWFHLSPSMRAELQSADFETVRKAFWYWCRGLDFPSDCHVYTISGAPALDYFIRHESLPEGVEHVCRKLEIPWSPEQLGRFKSGFRLRQEPFAEYYNRRTEALVRAEFAWELDYFGYSLSTA